MNINHNLSTLAANIFNLVFILDLAIMLIELSYYLFIDEGNGYQVIEIIHLILIKLLFPLNRLLTFR